jgi:aminopeptidase YwaD
MKSAPLAVIASLFLFALAGCSERIVVGDVVRGSDEGAETATAPAAATATATFPATATPAILSGAARFEEARAAAHIGYLAAELGIRVAGSPAERTAAEYIRDQFKQSGYDSEIIEFTFRDDPYRPASVVAGSVTAAGFAMAGSPGAKVSGQGVYVGLADDAGIAGRDLRGKVAIAGRGVYRFGEKAASVKAAGAIALVIANNEAGDLLGNTNADVDIPVVGVTKADGEALRTAAEAGLVIAVETPAVSATRSFNVLARPAKGASCRVLVGGHHDTVPGAPGAHDNASGTAETIELARAFAADGLDQGLCFATFGAEESGLNGSKAMAAELRAAGALPGVMVNLDTTGKGSRVDIIGSAEITRQALAVAQRLGIAAAVVDLAAQFGSDHQSFAQLGVPVVFFATDDFSDIHTPRDTVAGINHELFADQGELAYEVILQLLKQFAAPGTRS